MKKILMLGGSMQQVVAIKKAKEMGYYTIVCDYLEDNPGQNYADKFYLASTTDKELILKIAKKEQIDGILCYASDPAAPTQAYVAEKMNLAGNPYKSVNIMTNKDLFREFLKKNNFATPKAIGFSSYEEALKEIDSFNFPIIIKPVDSSGSKGVSKLSNKKALKRKIEYALSFSRCKRFIIEEYVEMQGYQVAGDGFSVGGKLAFRLYGNDHFDKNSKNIFVPVAASFPYIGEKENEIDKEVNRAFKLLKLKDNAYNFDIRVGKDGKVYLMELGPRNGGNMIPQIIEYATGINMVEYSIKAAMGEDISDLKQVPSNGYYAYYAIHATEDGILKEIEYSDELKENILEEHLTKKIGDEVTSYESSSGTIGILLLKFKNKEDMLDKIENMDKHIRIILEGEKMKNIVITGATGNTGLYLVEYLLNHLNKEEYTIYAIGRRETNVFNDLLKGARYIQMDIRETDSFSKLPKGNVEAIIHLAGSMPAQTKEKNSTSYIYTNIIGTLNVLEYAKKVNAKRIIYPQTEADLKNHWKNNKKIKPYMKRDFNLEGNYGLYILSKSTAMDMIKYYHNEYGIQAFILRLPTIYLYKKNPYYYVNGEKKMLGYRKIIQDIMDGNTVEVWGNKNLKKDIVYVKDYCQMIYKCILSDIPFGIYNVGTGVGISLEDQIKQMVEVFQNKDNPPKIVYMKDKPDSRSFIMDIENAKKELGYEPKYNFKDYLIDFLKEMERDKFDKNK